MAERRAGSGTSGLFLTVLFPHNQMQILAYNRAVRDLNGQSPEAFLGALGQAFDIEESGLAKPCGKHEICLYLGGRWRTLRPKVSSIDPDDPIKQLDVSILQDHALAPLLGIRSEEHTSELQSRTNLVCRLLLEKKKTTPPPPPTTLPTLS